MIVINTEAQNMVNEYAESVLPTIFAGATEQIGKLKLFGEVKSITSFYEGHVLIQMNHLPLVTTLIATKSANVGALQTIGTQLIPALEFLKKAVEKVDAH
jgi:mitogen-activated protein kinase kinase 1 interacting protein 1